MSKHNRVQHPTNGTEVFGRVPEIDSNGIYLPSGDIHLLNGEHYGPNRGFGVEHIIAEHDSQISRAFPSLAGMEAKDRVVAYVAKILLRRAPIFVEADRPDRPVVIHTTAGGVVLERRGKPENAWYSVVSAYNKKSRRGQMMGSLS